MGMLVDTVSNDVYYSQEANWNLVGVTKKGSKVTIDDEIISVASKKLVILCLRKDFIFVGWSEKSSNTQDMA